MDNPGPSPKPATPLTHFSPSGAPQTLYGLAASMPSASTVPDGSEYTQTDAGPTYQSQAGTWVQISGGVGQVFPPTGAISMGSQRLTTLADATAATDALNRQTGDARYDASGAAATAQTAATAASIPAGTALNAITAPAADLSLNSHKITSLADATAATDAMNRQSADARYIRTPTIDGPAAFGYLGWTNDPQNAAGTFTPVSGRVYLTRFHAVSTGAAGHVALWLTNAGVTLTAGDNFVGIYDTGQALAGSATLLGSSADQSTNWATGGYGGALGAATPIVSPPTLTVGNDYFVAILSVGTTPAKFAMAQNTTTFDLINAGLTGLALRNARDSDSGLTALPATITAAKTIFSNDQRPVCAIVMT